MERAIVNGTSLEYAASGSGEPVVFIHGALVADAFQPLLAELSLVEFRLISYHRRGYVDSGRTAAPVSLARQAADCRALLDHLGVERVHVVGHSFGGAIALQLALDAPDVVQSLALLEPALMVGASAPQYREALGRGVQRFPDACALIAVDEFLRARWPNYRARLDQVLPGAYSQAVADAATWFETEIPAALDWRFGEAEARHVSPPVLAVLGGGSEALHPRFAETYRLLLAWLPNAEGFVLPGATHFLHLESSSSSAGLASALAGFFARHRLVEADR